MRLSNKFLFLLAIILFLSSCANTGIVDEAIINKSDDRIEQKINQNDINNEVKKLNEQNERVGTKQKNLSGGFPFIDSDFLENLTNNDFSLKDDYAFYISKENYHKVNNEVDFNQNTINANLQKFIDIFEDESLSSNDYSLVSSLYKKIIDFDERNKVGITPLKNLLDWIDYIENLSEFSQFYAEQYYNPYIFTPITLRIDNDYDDSTKYAVYIEPMNFFLDDASEYNNRTLIGQNKYNALLKAYSRVMSLFGQSEKISKQVFDNALYFDSLIAESSFTNKELNADDYYIRSNNHISLDTLDELSYNFPLMSIMEQNDFIRSENFILTQPQSFKRLNEIYTADNLNYLKDYSKVICVLKSMPYLNYELWNIYNDYLNDISGRNIKQSIYEVAYDEIKYYLSSPLTRLYKEKYKNEVEVIKNNLYLICEKILSSYKTLISNTNMFKEDTNNKENEYKQKLINKLNNVDIHILFPDIWYDDSSWNIDNLNLHETINLLRELNYRKSASRINTIYNEDMWEVMSMPVDTTDIYYNLSDNSINIRLTIFENLLFDENMSIEELMGSIYTLIAHSISYCMDSIGIQFDENGNLNYLLDENGRLYYEKKLQKLATYLDNIICYDNKKLDGKQFATYTFDIISALQVVLDIAKHQENIDYGLLFENYAKNNIQINSYIEEEILINYDYNLPPYLAINVPLQQLNEFYVFYNINKNDNMFINENDRITIW